MTLPPRRLVLRRPRVALAFENLEDRSLLSGGSALLTGHSLPAVTIATARAAVDDAFVAAPLLQPAHRWAEGAKQSEVIVHRQAQTQEIDVAPDGTIEEATMLIAPEELPARVAASLASRFPGATIQKVEEVIEAGVRGYDVVLDWRREGALEVEIGLDGQIAAVERADDSTASPAMQTVAADSQDAGAPASAISGRQADNALESAVAQRTTNFAPAERAVIAPVAVALGRAVNAVPAAASRPLPGGVEQPGLRDTAPPQAEQSAGTTLVQARVDASRDKTDLEVAVRFASEAAATFALPLLPPRLAGLLTDAAQMNLQSLDVRALDQALSEFLNEVETLTNLVAGDTRLETAARVTLAAVVFGGLELVRREAKKLSPALRLGQAGLRNGCGLRDGTRIP